MKNVGIFFGSSTGTTEGIAEHIAQKLGVESANIYNVASASPEDVKKYEVVLFGTSTWGAGDLQDDWYDFLTEMKRLDFSGKLVGLFGCGDSASFSDTFCDAIGTIYQELQGTGAKFIGAISADGYSYDDSTAVVDGKFVGLALDEMNEDDQTESRMDTWIAQLKADGIE